MVGCKGFYFAILVACCLMVNAEALAVGPDRCGSGVLAEIWGRIEVRSQATQPGLQDGSIQVDTEGIYKMGLGRVHLYINLVS